MLMTLVFALQAAGTEVDTAAADGFIATLMGYLALISALIVVYYVVFAASLKVIARKMGRTDGWKAWVPLLNVILLCRMADKSLWWILGMAIPILAPVPWMALARRRNKPAFLGVLIIVPLVQLLVPLILASGDGGAAAGAPNPGAAEAAAAGGPSGRTAARRCGACGTVAQPSEAFCGECGTPLAAAAGVATAARPAAKSGSGLVTALATVVTLAGLVWGGYSYFTSYTAPQRQPPQMPERVRGIMREFPVDDQTTGRAKPDSVVTQTFSDSTKPGDVKVPQKWLPPGIDRQKLPQNANAVMTAAYRATPADPAVGVTVLDTKEQIQPQTFREMPRDLARDVAMATGGEQTGIAVERPADDIYRGTKIASPQGVTYVLAKDNEPVVIIIYATDPSVIPVADRLAANVGNGEGLNDYEDVQGALWTLPSDQVDDLELREIVTQTPEDVGLSADELQRQGAGGDADVQRLMEQVSILLPERFTVATYGDRSGREWNALILDYGSGGRAWRTWMLVRWTIGAVGMQSLPLADGEARYADSDGRRAALFRKGQYVVALDGPDSESTQRYASWADRFQM